MIGGEKTMLDIRLLRFSAHKENGYFTSSHKSLHFRTRSRIKKRKNAKLRSAQILVVAHYMGQHSKSCCCKSFFNSQNFPIVFHIFFTLKKNEHKNERELKFGIFFLIFCSLWLTRKKNRENFGGT